MLRPSEHLEAGRRGFSVVSRPPRLFDKKAASKGSPVAPFEPYEENLPLESGYYTYVLDREGRIRVKRGNTRSHSGFVGGDPIGAAGNFHVNRAGNLDEVYVGSYDYRITVPDPGHRVAVYVIETFRRHHALELSPNVRFRFTSSLGVSFQTDVNGFPLNAQEIAERQARALTEGDSDEPAVGISPSQIAAFRSYVPPRPPRKYAMHRDQLVIDIESEDEDFEMGEGRPPYSPDQEPPPGGKKAFILDDAGRLVIGHGHHLLSGGKSVGAAGQILIGPEGEVVEIHLNFSGHYRPPLTAEYARYTYRTLVGHPLLRISPTCEIQGRKFDDAGELSTKMRFSREELLGDDPDLDLAIEIALF